MQKTFLERGPQPAEAAIDRMEQLLRNKFSLKTGFAEPRQMAQAMTAAMKALDTSGSPAIGIQDFRVVMRKLNCVEDETVVDGLFHRYDLTSSGKVSLQEFANALCGLTRVARASPEAREVISHVTTALRSRGENSFRGLQRILRLSDSNGNGKLDLSELVAALKRYGISLSKEEESKVFFFFDRNGDGHVDISEFMVAVRPMMNPARQALVRLAFLRLDKNPDGQVTLDELRSLYRADKHPGVLKGTITVDDVLRQFSAAWNKNGDDVVSEEEFLDYYRDLSASIDNDAYFELMLRNAWRISGGVGAAANTANLRVLVTHLDGTQTVEALDCDLGLSSKDPQGVTAALRKQGVTDILKVEF